MKDENPNRQADRLTDTLANLLDSQFKIPGTQIRFGLDFFLGIFPGFGDFISSMFSLVIVNQAVQAGLPLSVVLNMFINILIDQILGSIPFIGDLFDIYWKANLKNAKLLRSYREDPRKQKRRSLIPVVSILTIFVLITGATSYLIFQLAVKVFHFLIS